MIDETPIWNASYHTSPTPTPPPASHGFSRADAWHARGKRYSLALVLMVIVLAKLSGEGTPSGIAEWAHMRCAQLVQAFGFKRVKMPAQFVRSIL